MMRLGEMHVTQVLWQAAGAPAGDGDTTGQCRVCGADGVGLLFHKWARPTFTDWDKLVPGSILCHACQFAFEEQSTILTERVGKDGPQRMRNYSHFVVGGEWIPLSKAQKAEMADILLNRAWQFAIVANSGQKHIIFRALPGAIQFEEQRIADIGALAGLLATVEALYTTFSKSEIETGEYAQHRIVRYGVMEWADLERVLRPVRQTALFELAVFLAQKGEQSDGDGCDTRESDNPADRDLAGSDE